MAGRASLAAAPATGPSGMPGAAAEGRREIARAGLEMLQGEFVEYLLRRCPDTRGGRELLGADLVFAGLSVGRRYTERLLLHRERIGGVLDIIKFICRSIFPEFFGRPVDRLRTDHDETFLLESNDFQPIAALSSPVEEVKADMMLKYTLYVTGVLRGALLAFGLDAVVDVDLSELPRATISIKLNFS